MISPFQRQELVVCALLDDITLVENHDLVRGGDGRETMPAESGLG
jgi:hypothetical protein